MWPQNGVPCLCYALSSLVLARLWHQPPRVMSISVIKDGVQESAQEDPIPSIPVLKKWVLYEMMVLLYKEGLQRLPFVARLAKGKQHCFDQCQIFSSIL